MSQSLATGRTIDQRYPSLGFFNSVSVPPLERTRGAVFGLPRHGKTTFFLSNPDAVIFNFDCSPTTTPGKYRGDNVKASFWPIRDEATGQLVDSSGKPIKLTWDLVLEKIEALEEAAKQDRPRPKTVVFDTLTTWWQLLERWIPQNAKALSIGENSDNWRDINGMLAYPTRRTYAMEILNRIHDAGYGIWLAGHLLHRENPIDSEGRSVPVAPTMQIEDKMWRQLHAFLDISAIVEMKEKMVPYNYEEEIKVQGETLKEQRTGHRRERTYSFTTNHPKFPGLTKARSELPDVELNPTDGWDQVREVYEAAVEPQDQE